jgi:hypothetical protein
MNKTIFLIASGAFVSTVCVLIAFNLAYWLFYSSHNAEVASGLIVFAIATASIGLSFTKKYRFVGVGMVAGCCYGIALLTLMLWGA